MFDYGKARLANAFILWCLRRPHPMRMPPRPQARSKWVRTPIVGAENKKFLFWRYEPFWRDESIHTDHGRPPWWRPFNLLLHQWCCTPNYIEDFHDHRAGV